MKEVQLRQEARVRGVCSFAQAHLAGDRTFDAVRARLDATLARVEGLIVAQNEAKAMAETDANQTAALRRALRERLMIPVAAAGRELLAFAPGAERALQVPKKYTSLAVLLASGERMQKLVKQHLRLFVGIGFRKTIADELRAATRALRAHTTRSGAGRRQLTKSTAGLARVFAGAQAEVNILGALLAERVAGDPALGAEWRQTRRVGARMGRPRAPRAARRPVDDGQ